MAAAMGRLFYHVIGSFSEFEREMIVERVRADSQMGVQRANPSVVRRTKTPNYAFWHYVSRVSAFGRLRTLRSGQPPVCSKSSAVPLCLEAPSKECPESTTPLIRGSSLTHRRRRWTKVSTPNLFECGWVEQRTREREARCTQGS